ADRMNKQIEESGVPLARVPRKTRTLEDEEAAKRAKGKVRTRGSSGGGKRAPRKASDAVAEATEQDTTPDRPRDTPDRPRDEDTTEVPVEDVESDLVEVRADLPDRPRDED